MADQMYYNKSLYGHLTSKISFDVKKEVTVQTNSKYYGQ